MSKQIYIDENGNELLVSGTINNAQMLPIASGSATNTKDYIDSGLSGKLNSTHLEFKIISGTTDANGFLATNLQSTAYIFLGVTNAHSRYYIPLNAFSDGTIRICALDTSFNPIANTAIDLNCLFYKV